MIVMINGRLPVLMEVHIQCNFASAASQKRSLIRVYLSAVAVLTLFRQFSAQRRTARHKSRFLTRQLHLVTTPKTS